MVQHIRTDCPYSSAGTSESNSRYTYEQNTDPMLENSAATPSLELNMSSAPANFHLFSRLPPELRDWIWRLCLPYRACQLDLLLADNVYSDEPYPCQLIHTNLANSQPPTISRVCRESRRAAFKAGGIVLDEDRPADIRWKSMMGTSPWLDRSRDLMHLKWNPFTDAMYNIEYGHPLNYMAWKTYREKGFVDSVTLDYMIYQLWNPYIMPTYDPDTQDWHWARMSSRDDQALEPQPGDVIDLKAILSVPSCLVVMRTIVIHLDPLAATSTGLFGLLGDAPVQIIDAREEARIEELWCLAETSERELLGSNKQDLVRVTADGLKQELKDTVTWRCKSVDLLQTLRPAIMFRLCTKMCSGLRPSDEAIRLSRMTEVEIAECRNPDGQLMPLCSSCGNFHNPRQLQD